MTHYRVQRARNLNPDRVVRMLKAERRRRGIDSNYYGADTPTYRVAQRFGITCDEVRRIVESTRPSNGVHL